MQENDMTCLLRLLSAGSVGLRPAATADQRSTFAPASRSKIANASWTFFYCTRAKDLMIGEGKFTNNVDCL